MTVSLTASSPSALQRLRTIWWAIHRWIALVLCVLLVPIAISGALLVWHDELDALVHPARFAVTGNTTAATSSYLDSARGALPANFTPMVVRFPAEGGRPVTVMARGEDAGTRQLLTVYLDPPSGRVLDVVNFRSSFFGFLHRFHENLTIPEYSGRAIVGWAGVGMLILSLTGLWLWWPRNGVFRMGLRWRRAGDATISNLHYLLGFWIALPLTFVSLTGIYLSFPQTARSAMSAIAPMNPQAGRPIFAAQLARETQLTPDAALDAARSAKPGWRPAALFLATVQSERGERNERPEQRSERIEPRGERTERGERPSATWRVQLRDAGSNDLTNVIVNDRDGTARGLPDPLAGDRAAQWIRFLHEGSRGGPIWQIAVFLTGVFPPIFAFTGIVMWLRRRSRAAAARRSAPEVLQAAE
jgi:uncharacterized iron-regulated membrane protein